MYPPSLISGGIKQYGFFFLSLENQDWKWPSTKLQGITFKPTGDVIMGLKWLHKEDL